MLLHRARTSIVQLGAVTVLQRQKYFVIPPAKCSKLKLEVLKNNKLFLIAMAVCLLLNSQIIPEALLKEDMKKT